jgi:hypothetical protein
MVAFRLKFFAEFLVIFDDAVVDDRNASVATGVRV